MDIIAGEIHPYQLVGGFGATPSLSTQRAIHQLFRILNFLYEVESTVAPLYHSKGCCSDDVKSLKFTCEKLEEQYASLVNCAEAAEAIGRRIPTNVSEAHSVVSTIKSVCAEHTASIRGVLGCLAAKMTALEVAEVHAGLHGRAGVCKVLPCEGSGMISKQISQVLESPSWRSSDKLKIVGDLLTELATVAMEAVAACKRTESELSETKTLLQQVRNGQYDWLAVKSSVESQIHLQSERAAGIQASVGLLKSERARMNNLFRVVSENRDRCNSMSTFQDSQGMDVLSEAKSVCSSLATELSSMNEKSNALKDNYDIVDQKLVSSLKRLADQVSKSSRMALELDARSMDLQSGIRSSRNILSVTEDRLTSVKEALDRNATRSTDLRGKLSDAKSKLGDLKFKLETSGLIDSSKSSSETKPSNEAKSFNETGQVKSGADSKTLSSLENKVPQESQSSDQNEAGLMKYSSPLFGSSSWN